jgi:sugar phosphate isomerase/epimerase
MTLDERVTEACLAAGHKKVRVIYSAYKTDDETDESIDNLDEIAAYGKIRLVKEPNEYWGGKEGRHYRSKILENPTWLQVALCANRMIRVTRDSHHVFLECIDMLPKEKQIEEGVTLYRFGMGS